MPIDRGLSQEDLAGLREVDRSYISMIEVGKNEPSVTKIFQLCDALQINPSSFLRLVEADLKKLGDSE
ncbi:helix-turn-helix domain-containing protein [Marinicrinis lubricantis]|uniref:Helix-turn-helix domain-containing protein n=1 Tax=Marinicrinis lubricantis TaxID=2086470 RepID=A0ABW1IKV4_9BACL